MSLQRLLPHIAPTSTLHHSQEFEVAGKSANQQPSLYPIQVIIITIHPSSITSRPFLRLHSTTARHTFQILKTSRSSAPPFLTPIHSSQISASPKSLMVCSGSSPTLNCAVYIRHEVPWEDLNGGGYSGYTSVFSWERRVARMPRCGCSVSEGRRVSVDSCLMSETEV